MGGHFIEHPWEIVFYICWESDQMESVYLSPNSLRVLTSISTHLYEYDLVTLRPLGEPGNLGDLTRVQTASHTLGF